MSSPRVLLLLSQLPQDPANGAARSMKTICEFLAAAGMEVFALATTCTESPGELDVKELLHSLGAEVRVEPAEAAIEGGGGEIFHFDSKRVRYALLNAGRHTVRDWEGPLGARFDAILAGCLRNFRPEIMFTFGGTPREKRAPEKGAGCGL